MSAIKNLEATLRQAMYGTEFCILLIGGYSHSDVSGHTYSHDFTLLDGERDGDYLARRITSIFVDHDIFLSDVQWNPETRHIEIYIDPIVFSFGTFAPNVVAKVQRALDLLQSYIIDAFNDITVITAAKPDSYWVDAYGIGTVDGKCDVKLIDTLLAIDCIPLRGKPDYYVKQAAVSWDVDQANEFCEKNELDQDDVTQTIVFYHGGHRIPGVILGVELHRLQRLVKEYGGDLQIASNGTEMILK